MAIEVLVKIINIELFDVLDGLVKFKTESGNQYQAFYWGKQYCKGEYVNISLSGAREYVHDWNITFNGNPNKEKKLIETNTPATYKAYGQIMSINPVITDFGDFKLNIGNWSNDLRIIGAYIYWNIERLEITI